MPALIKRNYTGKCIQHPHKRRQLAAHLPVASVKTVLVPCAPPTFHKSKYHNIPSDHITWLNLIEHSAGILHAPTFGIHVNQATAHKGMRLTTSLNDLCMRACSHQLYRYWQIKATSCRIYRVQLCFFFISTYRTYRWSVFDMGRFWHLAWANLTSCKFSLLLLLIPLYIFQICGVFIDKVLQGCIMWYSIWFPAARSSSLG